MGMRFFATLRMTEVFGFTNTYRAVTPSSMIDCTTANRLKQGYENDTVRVDAAFILKK